MEAAIRTLESMAADLRKNVESYTRMVTERRAALDATQGILAANEQSLAQVIEALAVLKANVGHKPPPQIVPRQQRAALLTPCPNCQQSHWTDEACRLPPSAPVSPPPLSLCQACHHAHDPGERCIGVAVGAGGGVVKLMREARGSSHLLSDEPLPSDKGPHDDSEILY